MRISALDHSCIALPFFDETGEGHVLWRFAERDPGAPKCFSRIDAVGSASWKRRLAEAVVKRLPPDRTTVSVVSCTGWDESLQLGAIRPTELDVVAGASAADSFDNFVVTALDTAAGRLLLRFAEDGMLEVIPFLRDPVAPCILDARAQDGRGSEFFFFSRFVDRVSGHPSSGTYWIDVGRVSPLRALRELLNNGQSGAASALAARFFAETANALLPVPYPILPGAVTIHDDDPDLRAEALRLAEAVILADDEARAALPITVTISLPRTPLGFAQVRQRDMMAARPLPRSCLERLVVLLNLAIRDLPGWGTRVHEDAPESPFFGFTPTDAVENAFLEIEIAADPSAHARVEAQGRVGAMWRERRNDPRLHQALAIAGSKDRDALLSAIDDRMGREGE